MGNADVLSHAGVLIAKLGSRMSIFPEIAEWLLAECEGLQGLDAKGINAGTTMQHCVASKRSDL